MAFHRNPEYISWTSSKSTILLEKDVYKFTTLTVSDRIALFDKLILPILNHCSEAWGFIQANAMERIHLQFCKKSTQSDFIYGEFGRTSLLVKRQYFIIKYWFKILNCNENNYIKYMYKMLLADLKEYPNKNNWAYLVKDLLSRMGFYDVWLNQVLEI